MCGIIGYIGEQDAAPILLEGLRILKYRGYDSAGIALLEEGAINRWRVEGKPDKLVELLSEINPKGSCGIGHNRWATHGRPSVENAHPHLSEDGRIAVVHNGTIENFTTLRAILEKEGYRFSSETDTEVLPHLIDRELQHGALNLEDAVERALAYVDGAYGIAVIAADFPGEIVAASLYSPIVIGLGTGELLLASDETALAGHVGSVLRLGNGEIITLHANGAYAFRGSREDVTARIERISVFPESIDHRGYEHMMLKEIHEQPEALANTLRGRLNVEQGIVKLGGLESKVERRLADSRRIVIVACGTALYAGMVGKLLIERFARIPVEVLHASEFQYQNPVVGFQDVVIGISQSGETADTVRAITLADELGALCLGVTNRTGTLLPRVTHAGVFLQAGPEHAVASTKAFTAQVVILALIAIRIAVARGMNSERVEALIQALGTVPSLLAQSLEAESQVMEIAKEYQHAQRAIFIGRRFGLPIALEGALKLAEISYIDALGFPAGELKHGWIALLEEGVPVFCVARQDDLQGKMLSNMEEVASRGGHVIALATEGDERPHSVARHVISLPHAPEELTPIVCAPVMQLLAYHMGVLRGTDVDNPRNLAKAVTVE